MSPTSSFRAVFWVLTQLTRHHLNSDRDIQENTDSGSRGLTWRPTPAPEEQAFKAMRASLAAGCNFWNAGEFYGTESYNSLHLLNKYFTKYPEDADKVVLSVKGVLMNMHPDGR
jgi:aryl-alcohol dehydrogenase-like predicted oxidoreductase